MSSKKKMDPATHAALAGGIAGLNPASALGSFLQHKTGEAIRGKQKDRSLGEYAKTGATGGAAMGAGMGTLGGGALMHFLAKEGKIPGKFAGLKGMGIGTLLGLLGGGALGGLGGGVSGSLGAASDYAIEDD